MRSVITTFITGFALILTTATASAQTSSPWWLAVGATGGFGQTWDDEGSIGKGWLGGGYADLRLFAHTDAEFSADVLTHDRSSGHFQARGHTTFVSAAIRQRFGTERTYAYVLGGVTLGAHSGTAGFPEEHLVSDSSGTHGGFIFGGGVNFRLAERLELGPVIRIAMLGADVDSDPASAIMTGVRIGLRR